MRGISFTYAYSHISRSVMFTKSCQVSRGSLLTNRQFSSAFISEKDQRWGDSQEEFFEFSQDNIRLPLSK